ncbi:hypothetical protein D769_23174 [Cupriavidus sp. HMR-1]|nr:hypothetical protein D769_23174 [Cupriavidus sp. HMR-1]
MQAIAASARVAECLMPFAHVHERISDFLACAAARVEIAGGVELAQRLRVQALATALPDGRFVRVQAQRVERAQDVIVGAPDAARVVDVLDPHEPVAAMGARVQPARQRGNQGAQMEWARGGGRKAAPVAL